MVTREVWKRPPLGLGVWSREGAEDGGFDMARWWDQTTLVSRSHEFICVALWFCCRREVKIVSMTQKKDELSARKRTITACVVLSMQAMDHGQNWDPRGFDTVFILHVPASQLLHSCQKLPHPSKGVAIVMYSCRFCFLLLVLIDERAGLHLLTTSIHINIIKTGGTCLPLAFHLFGPPHLEVRMKETILV